MARSDLAPNITAWVLVALVVAVLLYDTWAATSASGAPTISSFFRSVSSRYPILSFSLGVLIGHLLWPGSHEGS
jgi:hypothetical protein